MPATVWATWKKIPVTGYNDLAIIIRSNNFVCDECNDGYYLGKTERGGLYKVMCNKDRFAYRVIVRPNGQIVVSPWDE